jgi:hypothetical protein
VDWPTFTPLSLDGLAFSIAQMRGTAPLVFQSTLYSAGSDFPSLGLIVAILLVSRTAWGKRAGVTRLCAVGYLLYLAFLYWIGPTEGPDSMGYGRSASSTRIVFFVLRYPLS